MIRNSLTTLIVSLCILPNLAGCGAQNKKNDVNLQAPSPDADVLYQSENFSAAADGCLELAELDQEKSVNYYLNATEALIRSNKIECADSIIDDLTKESLNASQTHLKDIYMARLLIAKKRLDEAARRLDFIPANNIPREVLAKFYATRSDLSRLKKNYLAEINERLRLDVYLSNEADDADNYQRLWQALMLLTPEALNQAQLHDTVPDSWLELALIRKTLPNNKANFYAAVVAWRQRYPDHPASQVIVPELLVTAKKILNKPTHIALLLPFSERTAIATAIHEGFVAAYYEDDKKPTIRLYDTNVRNVVEKYRTAIQAGADCIVGPLQKDTISTLLEAMEITIPTLALNQYKQATQHADSFTPETLPSLIQFGLAPEDEAKQVAERAWFDGHVRAITITTNDPTGERIKQAFTSNWQDFGGALLDHYTIMPGDDNLKRLTVDLLNIEYSEQRNATLRDRLRRNLQTEPRRRQDIDLIFLAVSPDIARQIIPQFRYYKVDNIALYAISSIYTGRKNVQADKDMNDVLFADMPWVIDPAYEYATLQSYFEKYRKSDQVFYKKLYAFGIDAYHLIMHTFAFYQQPNVPFIGKTGQITIGANGLVRRRLEWARFVDGEPELLDLVHQN